MQRYPRSVPASCGACWPAGDVLLVEDDHCAGISGAPLHTLAGCTNHWAFVRSASKAYGPDLRVAVLAGDRRTVERVHGRLRLGPGWVSHLLQDLAVGLWSDDAATRLVSRAEARYTRNRAGLLRRLGRRAASPLTANPGSTSGFRCPTRRPRSPGCSTRAGPRRRDRDSAFARRPGMRVTVADLTADEIEPLADAIAEAVHLTGRHSV